MRRRKCSRCIKHQETIAGLKKDLQQCQEDSQEQQDRLEEQVFMKRTKLKGYVQLLYAKDNEIEMLETKCQQRASEVSELEDKYLSSIEVELQERRVALEKNIAEHSLSVSGCLNSGGSTEEQKPSKDARCGGEQSDDEKFLNSMEAELGRLIDQLWQEPSVSVETATGDLLNRDPGVSVDTASGELLSREPDAGSETDSSDLVNRASKRRKV